MLIQTDSRIISLAGVETVTYMPGRSENQLQLTDRAVGTVRHLINLTQPAAGEVFAAIVQAAGEPDSPLLLWEQDPEKSVVVNAAAARMVAFDPENGLTITLSANVIGKNGAEAKAMWEKLLQAAGKE